MNLTEKDTIQAAVSRLDFRTRAFVDGKFVDDNLKDIVEDEDLRKFIL